MTDERRKNQSDAKNPADRSQVATSGSLNLSILAEFAVAGPDGVPIQIASKKNRALLAILALSPGQTVTRERLASLLWGDHGEEQARNSLRQSLAVLRRELGPFHSETIQTRDDVVMFRKGDVHVDAVTVLRGVEQEDISTLRNAAQCCGGELLADFSLRNEPFEEWLAAERSRLKIAALKLFDKLVEREVGDARIDAAQRLVALDNLRESSHRSLMRAYVLQGNSGLALKQFDLCRTLLRDQLGVEPSNETQELRRQIAGGEYRSDDAPPPVLESAKRQTESRLPSIAVLPFVNLSADPKQDYISDGITENIITGLSRFRDLSVIAGFSTFAYKGKAVKVQDVSRELGVRFVLEGSVQTSNDRIRISTQLIDGEAGVHLWAERFDKGMDDVFAALDQVTEMIVARLATAYGGRLGKAWRGQVERARRISRLMIIFSVAWTPSSSSPKAAPPEP